MVREGSQLKRIIIGFVLAVLGIIPAFGQSAIYQQNQFLAGPTSGSGFPSPRTIVGGDLPSSVPQLGISTITSNTLLDATFGTVLCNAAGGPVTITLPALSQKLYYVKKIDSTVNACTVIASSGNIDNLPSVPITSRYTSFGFQNDGSQWWLL